MTPVAGRAGLQGSVNYQRLQSGGGPQDPYSGLFLAVRESGPGRPPHLITSVLKLERGRDEVCTSIPHVSWEGPMHAHVLPATASRSNASGWVASILASGQAP